MALLTASPQASLLILLAGIWIAAKLGGEAALRLKLPPVTGELAMGMLLSALHRWHPFFPDLPSSEPVGMLADLGVVMLMFAVGLESTVGEMLKVGLPSLRVALAGVLLPMAAGFGGAWLLLPAGVSPALATFTGACLCATSIGISAQVLRERGAGASPEGRVIIGAAVLDDVLGLLVLVAVTQVIALQGRGGLPWVPLGRTLLMAAAFLGLALTLGRRAAGLLFRLATRFRSEQLLLPLGLALAFLLAWIGSLAGLAPIVGAYAAGLILEAAHVRTLEQREEHRLEDLVHPLVVVLAPLFFVLMGTRVDPAAFLKPATLLLAVGLAVLGVAGKFLAGYAAGRGFRAPVIGWGMVPRGEVGLIFVAVGSQMRVNGAPLLTPELQAAVVGALLLTTVAGPVGLGWALRRD